MSETLPVLVVDSTTVSVHSFPGSRNSYLSIPLSSSSTNSRFFLTLTHEQKINVINPDYYINSLIDIWFFFLLFQICTTKTTWPWLLQFSLCLSEWANNKDSNCLTWNLTFLSSNVLYLRYESGCLCPWHQQVEAEIGLKLNCFTKHLVVVGFFWLLLLL